VLIPVDHGKGGKHDRDSGHPMNNRPCLKRLFELIKETGRFFRRFGIEGLTPLGEEGIDGMIIERGDLNLGKGGETKLNIIHSPGHSPGHITIYWPLEKVLIAGDVIFYGSTGRVDLPGGSARQLKQSIERLSEMDIEYLLCGHPYGHPGLLRGKEEIQRNFETVKRYVLF